MREHEKWLRIIREDLNAAKGLLKLELFSSVTYHCQQSAEKALKAYLIFQEEDIIKSHDLVKLVVLCCKLDSSFERLYDAAESLNPFSTKFRYPTEFDVPDLEDAKLAIKQTKKIVNFVLKKIAEPKIGQQKLF